MEQKAEQFRATYHSILSEIHKRIVGQKEVVESVVDALFLGGHVLLEGVPGLGKTLLVRTLAEALELQFSRIQFTPDLMPSDILAQTLLLKPNPAKNISFPKRSDIYAHLIGR